MAPASAGWAALLIPAGLYGGALVAQYGFGLPPCEMCYWQRWPHQAAILLAAAALIAAPRRPRFAGGLILLAALAVAASGAIGAFHAGVEYGWWPGLTQCSAARRGPVSIDDIMAVPIIRCDAAPWTFGPLSLAGFNAIFSIAGAGLIVGLLRRRSNLP